MYEKQKQKVVDFFLQLCTLLTTFQDYLAQSFAQNCPISLSPGQALLKRKQTGN